jgi:hypothetical protein
LKAVRSAAFYTVIRRRCAAIHAPRELRIGAFAG